MKAKEIIKIIENICPERLAYSWDNVGLLCGDENKDVKKVFVTLDTNINTIKEAISKNADMIISHLWDKCLNCLLKIIYRFSPLILIWIQLKAV